MIGFSHSFHLGFLFLPLPKSEKTFVTMIFLIEFESWGTLSDLIYQNGLIYTYFYQYSSDLKIIVVLM